MPTNATLGRGAVAAATCAAALLLAAATATAADPEFGPQTTSESAIGNEIWGMATADFDQDGRDDTVTANIDTSGGGGSGLNVQFGQPDGTLGPATGYSIPAGPSFVATGDLDGDGYPDMVGSAGDGGQVFMNDGDGTFTAGAALVTAGAGSTAGIAIGDFDEDGEADVIIGAGALATIFLGDGEGAFTVSGTVSFYEDSWVNHIVVADFEGDGSSDIAASLYDTENVEVLTSDGDGTFTSRGTFGSACGCGGAWGIAPADLNLDGRDDVVVGERWANRVFTIMSQGGDPPAFAKTANVSLPNQPYEANPIWVATGDLNGDGYPDAATADYMNDASTILVGDGAGSFTVAESLFPTLPSGEYFASHANAIADFDGDGRNDTAVASQAPVVAAFRNVGEPEIAVGPAELDFGDVAVGFESEPLEVEIANEGNAPLEVLAPVLSGPDAERFEVDATDCAQEPVLVGSPCTLEVTFAPTGLGPASATLEIPSDDPDGAVEVPLAGTGVAPSPELSVSPAAIDFGQQKVGTASAPRTVRVENTGTAALQVTGTTFEHPVGGEFVRDQAGCVGQLDPGGACDLPVRFSPLGAGASSAELVVGTDAGSAQVALTGTGTEPQAQATPDSIDFPDTTVGSESGFQTITIANEGEADLVIEGLSKAGGQPFDYVLFPGGCAGATVAPGGSCQAAVAFRPSAPGERSAAVVVASDSPGPDLTVPLTGTGTAVGQPAIDLSPALVNFGDVRVGTASAPATVTVSSVGDTALEIGAIAASGDFEVTAEDCPAALAPGTDCEVSVAFAPESQGPLEGALTVASDAPAGQASVALAGTGTVEAPARLLVSPGAIDFGERTLGTASPPATVTATNIGERPLAIGSFVWATAEAAGRQAFSLGNRCTGPLGSGESCTFQVTHHPSAAGTQEASLSISTSGGAATVRFSGTGVEPPLPPSGTAPRVRFTAKPRATLRIKGGKLRRARVAFASDQAGASFRCSLDGRAFAPCSSPRTLRNLKPGRHTFQVMAVSAEGSAGMPALAKFRVVRRK